MLLEIDDWRSVSDLQYRFNKCFPFLHLLVYDADTTRVNSSSCPLKGSIQIKNARKNHQPGVLVIKSWFTKKAVESMLKELFGLNARIFRFVGEQPVTAASDGGLTLQQLSAMAENAEKAAHHVSFIPEKMPEEWV